MTPLEQAAQRALSLMDLTSLNDDDTDQIIEQLCHQANTNVGHPAAVCVYLRFIDVARRTLISLGLTEMKVATVTNFPEGSSDIERAVRETRDAVAQGAHEVDVVFPYQALAAGDAEVGAELVKQCKQACGNHVLLKVIIESGELKTPELIRQASEISIDAGADFIKTSTGKVPVNATLEAADIMLNAIKSSGKHHVGFKAAGGVRTTQDAADYLALADQIMGSAWVTADHFRFGASSLLGNLLGTLGESATATNSSY